MGWMKEPSSDEVEEWATIVVQLLEASSSKG